jgi:hypothetical protein
MGLEGTGGEEGGSLLSAPGLAQKLEDEGTNEENANVLNLFLDSVTLPGGAPAPITSNVGSIDVTSTSIVFNGNLTRERYGRAAVQDPITLDSDKRSLLLDNNMTSPQKALSFIASLEFDNGLRVLNQQLSSSDVSNQTQPDLDKFNRYPESMFTNATLLNDTKETFVFDAFNASQDATDALASFEESP